MSQSIIHVITAVMKQLEKITSKVMMRQFIKLFAIHVINRIYMFKKGKAEATYGGNS